MVQNILLSLLNISLLIKSFSKLWGTKFESFATSIDRCQYCALSAGFFVQRLVICLSFKLEKMKSKTVSLLFGKVSPFPCGMIRCMAVTSDGCHVCVGHSSGTLSILDLRTGSLVSAWKGHEQEVRTLSIFHFGFFFHKCYNVVRCVSGFTSQSVRC